MNVIAQGNRNTAWLTLEHTNAVIHKKMENERIGELEGLPYQS